MDTASRQAGHPVAMTVPLPRLATITVLTVLLLIVTGGAVFAAPPSPAATSCDYVGRTHKVKVSAASGGSISRSATGHIIVNNAWCGGRATVSNTDKIVVLSGAGTQFVSLDLGNGGFRPGFTDEPGSSDEIEISISLGGDNDSLSVYGSDTAADHIVIGRSSGFAVMGMMNLNADETTGIDADLTLILGIEERIVLGRGGQDVVSGAGGSGAGESADFALKLGGGNGGDQLTGGTLHDSIIGGEGPDVLKGGGGPDFIDSTDGTGGNDQIFGGSGSDTCDFDSGDAITSCP